MTRSSFARWALINFILLACWGVLLRYMQFHVVPGLDYQFVLHGHSHFAFAGWMFLSLAILLFDLVRPGGSDRGPRAILILTLISSFGMLGSFSLQGYKAIPIAFSTLFILVTWWFSYLILRNKQLKVSVNPVAYQLITGAVFFLCLSSLGPFSLAPLMVNGLKNSPLYQDSIYFYLHFQMNGWMILAALGLVAARYLKAGENGAKWWLRLFVWSTVPLYFIFTLWSSFNWWLSGLALLGASMHLGAWIKLCLLFKKDASRFPLLVRVALLAITLKSIFQVLICLPTLGEWVFLNRNLIIGYVHLITLGSVSPLILNEFVQRGYLRQGARLNIVTTAYLAAVILYLGLLFLQPLLTRFLVQIPYYHTFMLAISVFFVLAGVLFFFSARGKRHALSTSS